MVINPIHHIDNVGSVDNIMKQNNDDNSSLITIVGSKMAIKGFKFNFIGALDACKDCKLYQVCMTNLEPNRLYEVIEVRKIEHKCLIHENGAKTVVVKEPPQDLMVKSRFAIEGVILTLQSSGADCPEIDCEHWDLCNNGLVRSGDRVRIVKKNNPVTCLLGKPLSLVLASRVQ